MSLFEDTNPRALKELLADIHNTTMVLPDFQRDFVWEPGATQELVVSIANNYPAGSILRVRDAKRAFAAREFDGAPALGGKQHTFLVLDGQQRLTSLYQAFFGVGEHRYYLSLRSLMDGDDFEEAIFHVRASTKWAKKREDFEVQAQELLLPLSVLRGGAGGFGSWSRKVARRLDEKNRIELEDSLDKIEEIWVRAIDDYYFPVVTLSDKTEPDALCTIFETLNRTGVKLSVFELLTARFWSRQGQPARGCPHPQASVAASPFFGVSEASRCALPPPRSLGCTFDTGFAPRGLPAPATARKNLPPSRCTRSSQSTSSLGEGRPEPCLEVRGDRPREQISELALGLESATPIPATSALCVAATILRDGDRAPAVLRLATTYALPLSRNPSRSGLGYTVGVDAGGRILLAGHSVAGPDRRLVLWRFYGDGSSDLTFGYAGVQSYAVPAGVTRGLAIDPSGRIIVTRSSGTLRIWP